MNYFLRNIFICKKYKNAICHMNFAPFVHENIRFMSIYFPRNFFTTPKHLIMLDATDCLGKYITTCIHIYNPCMWEKSSLNSWEGVQFWLLYCSTRRSLSGFLLLIAVAHLKIVELLLKVGNATKLTPPTTPTLEKQLLRLASAIRRRDKIMLGQRTLLMREWVQRREIWVQRLLLCS